ncbi:GntR family transcriptional regulator [Streptomyces californicus]|uniref:GntR family transcriptional regulator n=1 Tax=Streptomyces californicus TaxID=67351 RepID=UPI00379F5018
MSQDTPFAGSSRLPTASNRAAHDPPSSTSTSRWSGMTRVEVRDETGAHDDLREQVADIMARVAIQAHPVPRRGTLTRRVYDELESLLADTDTYPPGIKLPTYRALCQQYGVAQGVVGAAMEVLASQGRVWIRRPQGVFVLGEGEVPTPTKAVLIATAVRERIADGTLKPGIPLVPLLVAEFETNDSVVSSALRPLAAEGLLYIKHGSGTYVSPCRGPEPDRHPVLPPNAGTTQTTAAAFAPCGRNGVGASSTAHAARAAYQGVVDMLADTDTYPPGSELPARPVLAERFGVTPYALRKAIYALESDGRVQCRRSRTIVLREDGIPAPVPTTARLTEIVRDRIQAGAIKPGELISGPLMREFGVSKATVRRALTPLLDGELLITRPGIGTYVPPEGTVPPERDPAVLTTSARLGAIVRARIEDGTIQPGKPVSARLMEEFGVGKTTLHSALAPLVAEGLLIAKPKVGTYVPHSPTDASDRTCQSEIGTTPRTPIPPKP